MIQSDLSSTWVAAVLPLLTLMGCLSARGQSDSPASAGIALEPAAGEGTGRSLDPAPAHQYEARSNAERPFPERARAAFMEPEQNYPYRLLNRGELTLKVYLPDPEQGYYRGIRFDWSGLIGTASYGEHTFIQPWRAGGDPTTHEHVTGPVEEFGMESPLGYDEARPGELFVKIGVGALVRADEQPYRFHGSYELKQAFPWELDVDDTSIRFEQKAPKVRGWAYSYVKRLVLQSDGRSFRIEHELTNTGDKPIKTTQYAHNFFLIDGRPIGPDYQMRFSFPIEFKELKNSELVDLQERALRVTKPMPEKTSIWGLAQGYEGKDEFWFELANETAGLAVRGAGDSEPVRFAVWGVSTALCAEPFVGLHLKPGESTSWTTSYEVTTTR